jgi:putative inorganic carbon (HCO3(-)) transporter
MAAEAGMIGLLAYLLLIGVVVQQTVCALRRATDPVLRSTAVGGCGIIAAVAGHNLFENLHVLNFGIQLAVMWAIMGAIAQRPARFQPSICDTSLQAAPASSAAI